MSETVGFGPVWGAPTTEIAPVTAKAPGRLERLQDKLQDPERQARARRVAGEVGQSAMRGAVEAAGVATVNQDGTMDVRKRGIVKAVLMPKRTLRKASMGAVRGAREEVRDQATDAARGAVTSAFNHAPETPQIEAAPSPWGAPAAPVETGWGTPAPATTVGFGWGADAPPPVPAQGFNLSPIEAVQPVTWGTAAPGAPLESAPAVQWGAPGPNFEGFGAPPQAEAFSVPPPQPAEAAKSIWG
jgi:hypothetical protein